MMCLNLNSKEFNLHEWQYATCIKELQAVDG